jgi:hypothetical protein
VAEQERLRMERQAKKEAMKKKIAEEIERIKKLEKEQAEKHKAVEEQKAKTEVKKPDELEPKLSAKSQCLIDTFRLEKEREEMRIKSDEARKAAERRELAR